MAHAAELVYHINIDIPDIINLRPEYWQGCLLYTNYINDVISTGFINSVEEQIAIMYER